MKRLYWHAWSKSPGISFGSSNPRSSRKPSRHFPNDDRRISVSSGEPLIGTLSRACGAALPLLCLMTTAAPLVLKKLGWPLLEGGPAGDFDQIRAVTRQVAHALERDAAGESLIAKMDSTLQELAASKPRQIIRVAAWGEGGSIPAKGTLFAAILEAAGGVNVAATLDGRYTSFEVEQLIAARPDVLAYASDIGDTPGRNTEVAQHPLIRKLYSGRTVTYPGALYSCGVVESADAAAALRSSLLQ